MRLKLFYIISNSLLFFNCILLVNKKITIAYKKFSESARAISYVWYVKGSDYRLSHLLEKGHALRNGGRARGFGFIAKAKAPILESYMKKIKEVIENG